MTLMETAIPDSVFARKSLPPQAYGIHHQNARDGFRHHGIVTSPSTIPLIIQNIQNQNLSIIIIIFYINFYLHYSLYAIVF